MPNRLPQRHPASESSGDGSGSRAASFLSRFGRSEDSTEFYSPIPEGYQRGRHKYVAVFGTVMSGLGKGIFSSPR